MNKRDEKRYLLAKLLLELEQRKPPSETKESFLDLLVKVSSPPDMIEVELPPTGGAGFVRDAENIRKYFQRALAKF